MSRIRIGNGFDVHALVAGRRLVLGGVVVPYDRGLDGHSDADVLLHAVCDAILGALALGDIGMHFPDSDARWKGADSRLLLRHVASLATDRGYRVGNVDVTLIAQALIRGARGEDVAAMAAAALEALGEGGDGLPAEISVTRLRDRLKALGDVVAG